jgi:cytochrome c oxidase cbb3-type subunit 4
MTYEAVREFAGSWMLLFMVVFFVGAVLWALRPGSARDHRESANIIFRNEDAPADDADETDGNAEGEQAAARRKEART